MSSLIVEICKIEEVQKHPNADKLDIVRIKGWWIIVGRDQYKVNDLVTFIPVDSVLPANLVDKYNLTYLKNGSRVRTTKLRGFISQGLILPNENGYSEGKEVASELGITKWEPPVQSISSSGTKNPVRKRHTNQNFTKYTDIENIKHFNNVFKEGDQVVIMEKIHGSNWRAGYLKRTVRSNWFLSMYDKLMNKFKGEFEYVYGSHNVQLSWASYNGIKRPYYKENIYEKVANKYDIKSKLSTIENLIVYGEVYGDGVQDLTYSLKDSIIDLVVFDMKFNDKYLDFAELRGMCELLSLPMAPILYEGPYSDDLIAKYTSGKSLLDQSQIREGIVIRSAVEENNPRLGRKILKSISDEYLLRKDGTENH